MNALIAEKLQDFFEDGIPEVFDRDLSLGAIQKPARGNLATVITGVRRCGKTYRLFQEMHRVVEAGYPAESILYFNFEDERLKPYDSSLLSDVVETFFALRPEARKEGAFFFFDEIQEVPEWGTFLRRMVDTQKATIYITGSSSKMLSSKLASEFRGRALSRELFPLSFSEFVRFHDPECFESSSQSDSKALSSAQKTNLQILLGRYLERGGFIASQNLADSDAIQLLQEYAYRTVNLDIIERYDVHSPLVATRFVARCMASSGRELSLNKTANTFKSLGLSVSRNTLANLLEYYHEAYLAFPLEEYSRSLSQNSRAAAKLYAIDPGMLMAFSPSATQDEAQRLETAVYIHLRRTSGSLREGSVARLLVENGSRHEIDFVVGDALLGEQHRIIQVSCSLSDEKTYKREIAGMRAGMRQMKESEGWVVTLYDEEEIEVEEGTIHVVPAWKWLLE